VGAHPTTVADTLTFFCPDDALWVIEEVFTSSIITFLTRFPAVVDHPVRVTCALSSLGP
jgi:hypothetical protein